MRIVLALSASLSLACSGAGCSSNGGTLTRSTVTASVAPQTKPHVETAGAGGTVRLTEDMATPYFERGPARAAAAAFALERWDEARAEFAKVLASDSAPDDPADRGRMTLLMALADAELEQWDRAATGLERAAEALPHIRDYIAYHAARARYFAGDLDRALEHARSVGEDSIVGADADLFAGDILRAKGDTEEVARHYEAYLSSRPSGIRRAEARYRLAEAREASGDVGDETLRHYRTIAIENPTSSWGEKAAERLEALVAQLPEPRRATYTELSVAEHLTRAMAYYRGQRNPKAAAAFKEAIATGDLDDDQRCVALYHQAKSWYKERNRTRSAPLFDQAIEACNQTDNEDLQVKSAYLAGRSYDKIDDAEAAIARYRIIENEHKDHTYVDDARLRTAEEYVEIGKLDKADEILASIPKLYPDGDMRGEAVWRLAFRAFRQDDYRGAIEWLNKQLELKPIERDYWAEGQPHYWLGRAYAELGDTERSIASYEDAVRKYPLSYYALLALNRLRESHRERFDALVAEVSTDPDGHDPTAPAFSFTPRPVYGEPGFARGLEYMRLGLGQPAEAEFRRLGLAAPAGKDAVEDPDRAEKLWAMAFLHHRAGRYTSSHWVTRWHVLDYKRRWPVGKNRARWQIAYPRAWWPLLDRHANKHGYPTELLIAFVREESAFDPLRESWANAFGLTQMILPTARRFAEGTGIQVSRDTLRDPDKNVTIGSRFLDFLHETFDGRVALIVPSYNAGEGATQRWLRERGDWPTDEWSEAIPYDQARRYAKRVIASYFTYAFLRDGSIPEMPSTLP